MVKRRFVFLMKPGIGPDIEGLLLKYHRRNRVYEIVNAKAVKSAEETVSMSGPVFLDRENVFCMQEIT